MRNIKYSIIKYLIALFCWCALLCSCNSSGSSDSVHKYETYDKAPVIRDTELLSLFDTPSTEYNDRLSKIAVVFSDMAESNPGSDVEHSDNEIVKAYTRSDIGLSCINTYDFDTNIIFGGGAYAIGHLQTEYDGKPYTIIVITARGTKTLQEATGDYLKGGGDDFNNTRVFHNIYDFEEKIYNSFCAYLDEYEYILSNANIKILITGHSLGGAAANMIAARLDAEIADNTQISSYITKDDVYCYTYGAINVLTSPDNIETGYENIHNIYNYYDSWGPNGNLAKYGVSSPYSKFGHTEIYKKEESEDPNETFSCNNHTNYKEVIAKTAYKDQLEWYSFDTCLNDLTESSTIEEKNDSSYDELDYTDSEDENSYVEEKVEDNDFYIEPGTYVSTDGANQHFTFYEGNLLTLSAFGISAEGSYKITDGVIVINYNLLGQQTWSPSFSKDGSDIIIAGTRFVKE